MFLKKFMTLKANNTSIKKEIGVRTHSQILIISAILRQAHS